MAALVSGWALIVASPFVGILPGPGGIPVFLAGLVIVLRNSHGARRLFIRLQKRYPKVMNPVRQLLKTGFRDPKTGRVIDALGPITRGWAAVGRFLTPWRRRPA